MYKKLLTAAAVSIALSGCDISEDHHGPDKATNTVGVVSASVNGVDFAPGGVATIPAYADGMFTTLSVTGVEDANGNPKSGEVVATAEGSSPYTYQWFNSTTPGTLIAIDGETSSDYTLRLEDEGQDITVQVYYTDAAGNEEAAGFKFPITADSDGYIVIGCAAVGDVLTAKVEGDLDGTDTTVFEYVWSDVTGTPAGDTYTVLEGDLGNVISVSSTYIDDIGYESMAEGQSNTVVEAGGCSGLVANNKVSIIDTTTTNAGSFSYTLASPLTAGKLTAVVKRQIDEDSLMTETGKSQVTISGFTDGSEAAEFGFSSTLKYRNGGSTTDIKDANGDKISYVEDEYQPFALEWDADGYWITFKGETYPLDGSKYVAKVAAGSIAIDKIKFKIGDNSKVTNNELIVDDVVITDTSDGSVVWTEDFSAYKVDDELTDIDTFSDANEATVFAVMEEGDTVSEDFEDVDVGTILTDANSKWKTYNLDAATGTTVQVVQDPANANERSLIITDFRTDNKPLALRTFTEATNSGTIAFDLYIPSTNTKTTYVALSDGKNDSDRYFEFRFNTSSIQFESGSSDTEISATGIARDEWVPVVITWNPSAQLTLTLDGVQVGDTLNQADSGLDNTIVPDSMRIFAGDTKSDVNKVYIDNLESVLFD